MGKKLTEKEQKARERVCLALDVPTTQEARGLYEELSDLVGMVKVGKSLHAAACNEGVPIIQELYKHGANIFPDLKIKDTPDQAYLTAQQLTVPGVYMFSIHIDGGEEMCKQTIRGSRLAAAKQSIPAPKVIGVTVLTSQSDEDLETLGISDRYSSHVMRLARLAREWDLDGVVCSASMAGILEKNLGSWLYVTPGITWKGIQNVGQKQLNTPDGAVEACKSSILIIGSAITKSANKRQTTYEILQAMAKYL